MTQSILSNEKECYVCHTTEYLHRHHVFEGSARRQQSERHGCWIYLCGKHHNLSNSAIHFNKALDLKVKRECQAEWEKRNGSREDFIRIFGRSYI